MTLIYVDSQSYISNNTLVPILFGGGGTAWNLCVWEGCPSLGSGGNDGKIICAYGQSNAFRTLVPFFDNSSNLVHLQMIWIQSNNLAMASGLPGDESDVIAFFSMLTKVGELPPDSEMGPDADTEVQPEPTD